MRRRELLATVPTLALATAGCSNPLGGDDSGDSDRGPAETAREFWEAAFDGRIGDANALLHPETRIDPVSPEEAQTFQNAQARVESVSLVSMEGDTAIVAVTLSSVRDGSRQSGPETRFELRRADGEWRMYGVAGATDDGPAAPSVQWDVEERVRNEQIVAIEFMHNGGDSVESQRLVAVAENDTAGPPLTSDTMTAGDAIVVPLDDQGEPLPAGTEIDIRWRGPDGRDDSVVGEHMLSGHHPTAGGIGPRLSLE